MKAIMGTKITMTQLFDNSGVLIPVTIIKAEPNLVMEIKSKEKNNYISTKLGYKDKRAKSVTKPEQGVFKKLNATPKTHVREIRNMEGYKVGDYIDASTFNQGDIVDVQGHTKGHGFTGAIKR
jgi:large subunit ribosomal protein L3